MPQNARSDRMKTVVILTSNCFRDAGANGLCAVNLEAALRAAGYRVYLVGYTADEEPAAHEPLHVAFRYQRKTCAGHGAVQKVSSMVHSALRPSYDEELTEKYCAAAEEIIRRETIDAVVAVYYPLETLTALERLRRAHPQIRAISFELDSATDGIRNVVGQFGNEEFAALWSAVTED